MQQQGNLNLSKQDPKINTTNTNEYPSFERLDSFGRTQNKTSKEISPFSNIELRSSVNTQTPIANLIQTSEQQTNNQMNGTSSQNNRNITPFNSVADRAFKNNGSAINQNSSLTESSIQRQNETSALTPAFNSSMKLNQSVSSSLQQHYFLDGNMSHNASQEAIFPQARFSNSAVAKLTANIPMNVSTTNANRAQPAGTQGTESISNSKVEPNRLLNASNFSSSAITSLNPQNLGNSQFNGSQPQYNNAGLQANNTSTNLQQQGNNQFNGAQSQYSNAGLQANMSTNLQQQGKNQPQATTTQFPTSTAQQNMGQSQYMANSASVNRGVNQANNDSGVQAISSQGKSLSYSPHTFSGLSSASAISILQGNSLKPQTLHNNSPVEKSNTITQESGWTIKPKNLADALDLQTLASQQSTKSTLYHLFDNKNFADSHVMMVDDPNTRFRRAREKEFSKLITAPMVAYQDHFQKSFLNFSIGNENRSADGFGMFNIENSSLIGTHAQRLNTRELSKVKASGFDMPDDKIQSNIRSSPIKQEDKNIIYDHQVSIDIPFDHVENPIQDPKETHQTVDSGHGRIYSAALIDFFKKGSLLNETVESPARHSNISQGIPPSNNFFETPVRNRNSSQVKQSLTSSKELKGFLNKSGDFLTTNMLQDGEDSDRFFYRTPVKKIFPPNLNTEKPRNYNASTLADGNENEPDSVLDRSGRMMKSSMTKKSAPKNEPKVEKGSPEKYLYFEKDIQLDDYDYQIEKLKEHGNLVINESLKFRKEIGLKSSK